MNVKNLFREAILNLKIWSFGTFPSVVALFYKLFWSPKNAIDKMVSERSESTESFRFLQIGANDGIVNDPIMKFIFRDGWSGIRVEPLSAPFEKLKRLHASTPHVKLLQEIVADQPGSMPLYYLSFSTKRWATGLASLDRNNLERQIENGYVEKRARKYGDVLPENKSDWIISHDLNVREVNQLIDSEFDGSLDLLQIDTEGFDHVLVNALDLNELDISLICFEKLHLSENELKACLNRLTTFGYQLLFSNMDILAYKPKK